MGLQIPYSIFTQVSQKETVWKISESYWRNNSGFMSATGSGIVRRAFDAGRLSAVEIPTKIIGYRDVGESANVDN